MRSYTLIASCLLLISCTNHRNQPDPLQQKIDHLNHISELGNHDSALHYLVDNFSREEMVVSTDHQTPMIRILAYQALLLKKDPGFFTILKRHLSDTQQVQWWYADDVADSTTIADLMITKASGRLNRLQKDTLIDLVLSGHTNLETAKRMIKEIPPQEKYYAIIRKEAARASTECHDLRLIFALAKFKKESDTGLIRSKIAGLTDNEYCNNHIFRAIEVFPNPSFFPILEQYLEQYIRKDKFAADDDFSFYCKALAQYKNKQALRVLTALTKGPTYPDSRNLEYNKQAVFRAIYQYNCALYQGLYKTLKPQMPKDVLEDITDTPYYDGPPTW